MAFSAHVIWRGCLSTLNATCLVHDVVPLLRGAIESYRVFAAIGNDGLVHLNDVRWDSSTAPAGVQMDNTYGFGGVFFWGGVRG